MERKFSKPVELQEFFLSELRNVVGEYAKVESKDELFDFQIFPIPENKCLFEMTIRNLIKFFEKYGFNFYIDFEFGKLRAYSSELIQRNYHRL